MFLVQDLDDFDHHILSAGHWEIYRHTPFLCALSWIKSIGVAYLIATAHSARFVSMTNIPFGGKADIDLRTAYVRVLIWRKVPAAAADNLSHHGPDLAATAGAF
jgi:hypothetical protein